MDLILKYEVKKGVSQKTNEPYEIVIYYVEVNGLKIELDVKERLGKQILDNYYNSIKK